MGSKFSKYILAAKLIWPNLKPFIAPILSFLGAIGDVVINSNRYSIFYFKKGLIRVLHFFAILGKLVLYILQAIGRFVRKCIQIVLRAGDEYTEKIVPWLLSQSLSVLNHFQLFVVSFLKFTVYRRQQTTKQLKIAAKLVYQFSHNGHQKLDVGIDAVKRQLLRIKSNLHSRFAGLKQRLKLEPHISVRAPTLSLYVIPKPTLTRKIVRFITPPPAVTGFFIGVVLTLIFVFIPYNIYVFIKLLPNPYVISSRFIPVTTQIFDRSGTLLYEIHGDEDRKPVALSNIPEFVKNATIAIEDKDFWHHRGISLTGITRAARETFLKQNVQGGSTITQQLIKNSILTPEISITRKIREAVLAFWTEQIYTKNQILEMYLNQVPFGGTAWGIEAAAERYFGKSIASVNLAEAAFLAGLPAAPTLFSPYGTRPEMARVRQHEVLRRMVEDGYISQEQANIAQNTPLSLRQTGVNIKAPHFVMYIRDVLTQKYGARLVELGGLRIRTSLDLTLQEKVQTIVTSNIATLEKLSVGNGAALVTNPKNGDILAMVGSKNYFDTNADGNVNVVLSERQPGSAGKPIMYAAALEQGLTAMSFIDDTPVSFPVPGQMAYAPVNYDGRYHGRVTIRTALANSYNIPAVKILDRIGVKTMLDMGKRMGITTWTDENRYGLSLALGGGEVKMIDMSVAYGVLANSGERVDLDPILEITDYTGKVLYKKSTPKPKVVFSPEIAFILSDILADNNARTAAFGSNSTLKIANKTVSVKTGTTNEKKDNWTIGYTPSYVVSVWVGNNDNKPMNQQLTSGITGAAPIWNQIMSLLLADKPDEKYQKPETVLAINCSGKQEYFIKGTEPKYGCPRLTFPSTSPETN